MKKNGAKSFINIFSIKIFSINTIILLNKILINLKIGQYKTLKPQIKLIKLIQDVETAKSMKN